MNDAGRWSDAALDHWRTVGDEPADRAVAAYFATIDTGFDTAIGTAHADAGRLLGSLVAHTRVPPEDQVPAIAEFLTASARLPDWADEARIGRGQRFFSEWALHQFTALYLASLPTAYAAARGVHVLWLTARLRDQPERRLNETGQFLMDVSAPGSLRPGGAGVDRILHVRLMHAAVRWLVDHDPGVDRPADADPAVLPSRPTWATAWGRPLNQEDLAGTMLTFTTVVLDAFDRSGVAWTRAGGEDHLHLWLVIAHLLGVRDELLPRDLGDARALQRLIFRRQQARSAVGEELTATLLGLTRGRLPRPVAALAPAMLRRYVGADVADMIGVPASGSHRIVDVLVLLTRVATLGRRVDPVPAWLSERVGRRLVDGMLRADRGGARVPFAIPDGLGGLR